MLPDSDILEAIYRETYQTYRARVASDPRTLSLDSGLSDDEKREIARDAAQEAILVFEVVMFQVDEHLDGVMPDDGRGC